jgi:hypothetical protein
VEEVKAHPWFAGLDWANLRALPAPYLPEGSARMKDFFTELRTVDSTSPRYATLVQQITANFDDFKDDGSVWLKGGGSRSNSTTNNNGGNVPTTGGKATGMVEFDLI